jgi:hypothetical protein
VEGSLAAAFASRRSDAVAQLAGMMESVGRGPAVQKLYISARSAPLQVHLFVGQRLCGIPAVQKLYTSARSAPLQVRLFCCQRS